VSATRTSIANPSAGFGQGVAATCSTGTLVGGGGTVTDTDPAPGNAVYLAQSNPTNATTWTVRGRVGASALTGGATFTITAYAICAT
jgi:hypothetical protein